MIEVYLDLLGPERKDTFLKLKCLVPKGTLAGGTALSLQIKHRLSFDFDIFFEKHIIRKELKKLAQVVGIQEKRLDQPNQITFLTWMGIQVRWFIMNFLLFIQKLKLPPCPYLILKTLLLIKLTLLVTGQFSEIMLIYFFT